MTTAIFVALTALGADYLGHYTATECIGPGGGTMVGTLTMSDDVLLCFGDSTCDYWFVYNSGSTQLELWATDADGGGTDGEIMICPDGGDDCAFQGVITFTNAGIHILDTNASHDLVIKGGSDLTADRILTLTTGDAARTLDLEANATLDQDYTSDANVQFATLTLNNTGLHVLDTNASHDLIIAPGSDVTADRTLTLTTGDADRTVTLSGDLTIEASSIVNQDLSTDSATAQLGTLTVGNTGLVVGASTPFSDSSGTLTLQTVDALDATSESTIEAAIDTLANLTSVQGQTVTLSGALTVESASLINQDLTTDATGVQFADVTLNNTGLHVLDTNASHDLIIKPGSDITADRTLTVTTGDADRAFTLSGDLTVEAASTINQDLSTDATGVQFADAELTTGPLTVTSDANGVCVGAAGTACTDGNHNFDGTDWAFNCPGCTNGIRINAPLIGGPSRADPDSGRVMIWDMAMTSDLADGDEGGLCLGLDGQCIAEVNALSDGSDGIDTEGLRIRRGGLYLDEVAATPDTIAGVASLHTTSDNVLIFTDGAGTSTTIGGVPSFKSYTFSARSAASGTYYIGGFYYAPAADANLTQASATVTLGTANHPAAAHAFLVAGGAGSTDAGTLIVTVSGTSITDAGVRTGADSEVLIGAGADVTACQINADSATEDLFCETAKKWIGTVTWTLSSSVGPNFSFDFNYGLNKYEDWGNRDFTLTDFECTGLANAADASFNIQLIQQQLTGWDYDAAAFDPGGNTLLDMNTIHSTESDIAAGEQFAFKRASMSTVIDGSASEGLIVRVVTGTNNSVSYMNCHVGVTL